MKIRPEHYAHMKAAMAVYTAETVAGHRAWIERNGKPGQDVEMRLRWDLLHTAGITPWINGTIYPYANDDHIDTALRAIMKELF